MRSDLRIYGRKGEGRGGLLVSGEMKLPGTPLGRSAYDPALLDDAYDKTTRQNCRYFFTWNVEESALFPTLDDLADPPNLRTDHSEGQQAWRATLVLTLSSLSTYVHLVQCVQSVPSRSCVCRSDPRRV